MQSPGMFSASPLGPNCTASSTTLSSQNSMPKLPALPGRTPAPGASLEVSGSAPASGTSTEGTRAVGGFALRGLLGVIFIPSRYRSTWGSSTQRVCLAVSSTTTSTLQRVMHSRLGDLRRRTPCPPPRSSSHHSLNTSIEDEKRAGLCRVRSADVCAPRRCKWPKVHTTPCPMKYEAEGQRNAVAKKKEIAKLLFVTCQKLLHRQNCAEAEEVGSNSDDNKNAMQSLFWLEGPKPTKTASAAHSSTNCRGRFSSFAAFGNSYDRGGVSQRDWRHPTEASESEATPREKQRPRSHSCHERLILKPLLGHVAHGSKF